MVRPLLSNADRADVFRGLAHPARRRVWRALAEGDKTTAELMKGLRMSMSGLAQHLRVMREAGLISPRVTNGRRYYQRNKAAIGRARRWVEQNG